MVHFYHPDMKQTWGTLIGGLVGFFKVKFVEVAFSFATVEQILKDSSSTAINAAIGATVGFVVTTLWRYVFEYFKKRKKEE